MSNPTDGKAPEGVKIYTAKMMAVEELKQYERNPKRWPKKNRERLRECLVRFGVVQNLILNRRTGTLVDGNGRSVEVGKLGVQNMPVVELDISADEENVLRLALLSRGLRGVVTDKAKPLVDEAQMILPELYAALGLGEVRDQIESDVEKGDDGDEEVKFKKGKKGKLVVKKVPQKDVELVERKLDAIAALNKVDGEGARAYALRRVFADLEPKDFGPGKQERGG